jgi:hypothetical protein
MQRLGDEKSKTLKPCHQFLEADIDTAGQPCIPSDILQWENKVRERFVYRVIEPRRKSAFSGLHNPPLFFHPHSFFLYPQPLFLNHPQPPRLLTAM